jgi:hypothetical protein
MCIAKHEVLYPLEHNAGGYAMNIYSYLASPNIAAHCERIGHVFNPLEMAVIVAHSEKTMKEKHSAWREIIAEYPDMPIHDSLNFHARESLHEYLRELIALEEKRMEIFFAADAGAVYSFRVLWQREWSDRYAGAYSTFEKAWAALLENWDLDVDRPESVKIVKTHLDTEDNTEAYLGRNGELLNLYVSGNISGEREHLDDLDMIFMHLPVPFEEGDIVTIENGKPGVLVNIPQWDKYGPKYEERLAGKSSDGSDMTASCYFTGEDGRLIQDVWPYGLWKLRYFNGELTNRDRFLKYLSQYIKNKDSAVDWLINVFLKFKEEADSKESGGLFGHWYLELEEND